MGRRKKSTKGGFMKDICPCRDDAQPHIFRDGRCVLCYIPVEEAKRNIKAFMGQFKEVKDEQDIR